jgi:hypothetical protein
MEMTIDEICKNALGLHMGFWRLGFVNDDIFIIPDPDKICVVLRTQGKQFAMTAGPIVPDWPKFIEAWLAMIEKWNNHGFTEEETARIYLRTGIPQRAQEFVVKMLAKGFVLPKLADRMLMHPTAEA